MVKHIRVKRMWAYVHKHTGLSLEELAHVSECELCLSLFKVCVHSETPEYIVVHEEDEDEDVQGKSA